MTSPRGMPSRAKRPLVALAIMVGLLFLDGHLGPISFASRRVTAASVLAAVALSGGLPPRRRLATMLATWAAIAVVAQAPTLLMALLGYVFAVAISGVNRDAEAGHLVRGLAESCLTYVGLRCVPDLLPQSRVVGEALSASAHLYLRSTAGRMGHLSPTALGVSGVALSVIYLLWRWRLSRSRRPLYAAIVVPIGWFFLLAPLSQPASAGPISIFARGIGHGVFWLGFAILFDAFATEAAEGPGLPCHGMRRGKLIFACLASLFVGVSLVGVVVPGTVAGRRVLVHNRGGLDWHRPVYGQFGAFSGGMFGLLPIYARANGYSFEILDRDTIRPQDLSRAQTLVLINSPKVWKGDESRTIRDFVARGGSLLVLGDHTDVFGLMTGFNSLLEEFGILFQFDSAYFARSTWRGCLSPAPDAVSSGWDLEIPGVAIGASLRLSGWSRPLLDGRYGHSDRGARENVVGSFLGNYTYDDTEKLGDLTLIATTTHGYGRIVVFGDTSPFQGSLNQSFSTTIGPLLALLSRPTTGLDRPLARTTAALVLVALLLVVWGSRGGGRPTATIAATLLLGTAGAWFASGISLRSPIAIGSDCFLIDRSHLPAVGHYEARVNPSGPLATNLLRFGFRVVDLDNWDRSALAKARGIAFIAPQRSFSRAEVDDLLHFEDAGGLVLIAAGQPDSAPCLPLLRAHGLSLEGRPLGSIPSGPAARGSQGREQPRFLDAWPIVGSRGENPIPNPDIDVLYSAGQDIVVLFHRHGSGGLLLFSDSRFFSTMNIEDVSGYWVGNLALVHEIFQRYLNVNSEAVRPVFPSPRKPE